MKKREFLFALLLTFVCLTSLAERMAYGVSKSTVFPTETSARSFPEKNLRLVSEAVSQTDSADSAVLAFSSSPVLASSASAVARTSTSTSAVSGTSASTVSGTSASAVSGTSDKTFSETEKKHLKFYASFDEGTIPEIAKDGARLHSAGEIPSADGKFGSSLYFSSKENPGDLLYETGKILCGSEWSIAFWLKLDEPGNADYGKPGPGRGLFRTNMGWASGNVYASFDHWDSFLLNHFDGAKKTCGLKMPSTGFQAQKWIHLTFVFKNGKHFIYINGNEASYSKIQECTLPPPPSTFLRIGSMDYRSKDQANGCIDELKLFDRALAADEAAEIMATRPGKKEDLTLYLPLDGEISGKGFETFHAAELLFADGKSSKGVKIIRHGYDRYGKLTLEKVTSSRIAASLIFHFIPDWSGKEDSAEHGLFLFKGESLKYSLTVKNQKLNFEVTSGSRTETLSLPAELFEKGKLHRVTAGYDFREGKLFLAVGETISEKNVKPLSETAASESSGSPTIPVSDPVSSPVSDTFSDAVSGTVSLGNSERTDTYSQTQAEGLLDELLILNRFQSPSQLEKRQDAEIRRNKASRKPDLEVAPILEQEKALWDLNGAERVQTAVRERITLNALWRMQLTDKERPFNPRDWIYLAVPGRFSGQANGMADCEFFMRAKNLKKLPFNAKYAGKSPYAFVDGWFERAFLADEKWKGREIALQIQELGKTQSGTIYLNGKVLAELRHGGSMFEILVPQEKIQFGKLNFLTIHTRDSGQTWAWRGIKGDVSLEIRNSVSAHFPALISSVKRKTLKYELELVNRSSREVRVLAEAEIQGKNAPKVIRSAPIRLAPKSSGSVEAEIPWENAELWSPENPYLYSCTFRVREIPNVSESSAPSQTANSDGIHLPNSAEMQTSNEEGRVLDELPPIRFGFREFEIRGRDFFLNGQKIHLFTHNSWGNSTGDLEEARRVARTLKRLGFNSVRTNFSSKDQDVDAIMRICDEEGLLQLVGIDGVASREYVLWNDPETRAELEERMAAMIRRWRNHPSNVIWFLSINFLGYGWDYHPLKMADGYLPKHNLAKFKVCEEGVKILRKYDDRPYFFQAGGNFGEIHTSNAYFCWWPQTERNAWPAEWSKIGEKPLHIIETSFPYFRSFYGMDLQSQGERPLFFFENLARYYGPKVYRTKDSVMLEETAKSADGERSTIWYDSQDFQKIKTDLLAETIPFWRSFGISGICPFAECLYAFERNAPYHSHFTAKKWDVEVEDFRRFGWQPDLRKIFYQSDLVHEKPLPTAFTLQRVMNPKLIHLDGGAEDPVDQSANCVSGEILEKRLVLMNNSEKEALFAGRWFLGESGAFGKFHEILQPGEIRALPIHAQLPNVERLTEMELCVELENEETRNSVQDRSFWKKIPLSGESASQIQEAETPKSEVEERGVEETGVEESGMKETGVKEIETKSTENEKRFTAFQNPPEISLPDPFKVRIYPTPTIGETFGKISLFDPAGKTEKKFRQLGVPFQKLTREDSFNGGLLVLGAESLSSGFMETAKKWNLASQMETGKALLLVMVQKPEALALVGLRTSPIYACAVFDQNENQLGPWAGKTTFVPEKPLPPENSQEGVSSPLWHWVNTNIVSSYPILRPSEGAFNVLLTCGKDLVYSPLVEFRTGKGKAVFCQLEIETRTVSDPQADQLLVSLLQNYSGPTKFDVSTHVNSDAKPSQSSINSNPDSVTPAVTPAGSPTETPTVTPAVTQPVTPEAASVADSGTKFLTKENFKGKSLEETVDLIRREVSNGANAVLGPEFAEAFGLKAESREIQTFAVTPEGKAVFEMLTARDCFFRAPVTVSDFSGQGTTPLTEPAFAVQMKIGKGKIIFLGLPKEPRKEERIRGEKNGLRSSELWSAEILENRLLQIRALAGSSLGEETESIADRFEGRKTESLFPYSHSKAEYPTEKHVRW